MASVKKILSSLKSCVNGFSKLFDVFPNFGLGENLKKRIITTLILLPIAIYAIFSSESLFTFISILAAILMMMEWNDITRASQNRKKWQIIGIFYVLIPIYSIIEIRSISSDLLFWMFAIIWATDIFAYFAGKSLKGPKLAPKISPNKTWSGLLGGVSASALIGFFSSIMFPGTAIFFIGISILLSVLEQISDLLESKVKRIFGVKDSGNLIPGHGGVLDRLDGIILVAPFLLFLISLMPEKFIG